MPKMRDILSNKGNRCRRRGAWYNSVKISLRLGKISLQSTTTALDVDTSFYGASNSTSPLLFPWRLPSNGSSCFSHSQISLHLFTVPFTSLLKDIYVIARPVYHLFYRLIHFSREKNQSKWQPVCHNAVVPHLHVNAEYPYRGIEYYYSYFRRNSRFRRYQSGKVPVDVLRGHSASEQG